MRAVEGWDDGSPVTVVTETIASTVWRILDWDDSASLSVAEGIGTLLLSSPDWTNVIPWWRKVLRLSAIQDLE